MRAPGRRLLSAGLAAAAAVAVAPADARGFDPVVDPSVAAGPESGAGRVAWIRQVPAAVAGGAPVFRVVVLGATGGPVELGVAPLDSVTRELDAGTDAEGRPVLLYEGCRDGRCGRLRFDVAAGRERPLRLPRPLRGCAFRRPVIDRGRLYAVQDADWPEPARACRRAGLYELRGDHARRVVPGRLLTEPDVVRDIAVFTQPARTVGSKLVAATTRGNTPRLTVTAIDSVDYARIANPAIDGPDLVWSEVRSGSYARTGRIVRAPLRDLGRCRALTGRTFEDVDEGPSHTYGASVEVAPLGPRLFFHTNRDPALREMADPPPRWSRIECSAAAAGD